jgi:hypothetical protein
MSNVSGTHRVAVPISGDHPGAKSLREERRWPPRAQPAGQPGQSAHDHRSRSTSGVACRLCQSPEPRVITPANGGATCRRKCSSADPHAAHIGCPRDLVRHEALLALSLSLLCRTSALLTFASWHLVPKFDRPKTCNTLLELTGRLVAGDTSRLLVLTESLIC